ncbi:MAG: ATP-grasp domain-containing protein [Ignavibacteriae bacterium]|nr:ATP-grasp domain-containing protein [Ignavibacteriota bacterium]
MKKLAIIGASYLQLPLVRKAREMGIETHCFAWLEGAVCKDECNYFYNISTIDKEEILEKCTEIGIDGILTIASDIAVPTVSFISNELGLIGNGYNVSNVSTNKFFMRERFIESNVPSPKFILTENIRNINLRKMNYPLIVKPTDRSGSRGVQKVTKYENLNDAVTRALSESFSNSAIIEEYIEGREVSVETISWDGGHYILAITDKVTTGEPHFVEIEHHQPTNLSIEVQNKIKKETVNALNALNIKYGASHSEYKITANNKVFAIEVAARMGGDFIGSDLVFLSTGYDYLKNTINVALGNFCKPIFGKQRYSGIYFLSYETQQIKQVIVENKIKEIVSKEITNEKLKILEKSADRSGYLIYQGSRRLIL